MKLSILVTLLSIATTTFGEAYNCKRCDHSLGRVRCPNVAKVATEACDGHCDGHREPWERVFNSTDGGKARWRLEAWACPDMCSYAMDQILFECIYKGCKEGEWNSLGGEYYQITVGPESVCKQGYEFDA